MSLDDTFNMDREKLIDGDIGDIEIPDDPEMRNLDLIIDFALKAYQEQMEVISFLEPKNRLKAYEVAERYLNQAKDARVKKEKLAIDLERTRRTSSKSPQEATGEEKEDTEGGVSRKELAERMRVRKIK